MNDTIPTLAPYLEPSPVSFSLETPGWYVIGVLLIFIVSLAVFLWVRHYYRNRYRKISIRLLEENMKYALETKEYANLVYNANMIAKQICIHLYGRKETAPLKDTKWVIFLNRSSALTLFSTADEQIIRAIYDPETHIERQQAINFADKIKSWIKKHHSQL